MKRLALVGMAIAFPMLFLSCFGSGDSRIVSSCDECTTAEFCVNGNSSLYCANPCIGDFDCGIGFWCVPLTGQGNVKRIRWVCMPNEYYTNKGSVRRMEGDCTGDPVYACKTDEKCLFDDSGYFDDNDVFFCATACVQDSDCLTGCCQKAEGDNYYCTPFNYCEQ